MTDKRQRKSRLFKISRERPEHVFGFVCFVLVRTIVLGMFICNGAGGDSHYVAPAVLQLTM